MFEWVKLLECEWYVLMIQKKILRHLKYLLAVYWNQLLVWVVICILRQGRDFRAGTRGTTARMVIGMWRCLGTKLPKMWVYWKMIMCLVKILCYFSELKSSLSMLILIHTPTLKFMDLIVLLVSLLVGFALCINIQNNINPGMVKSFMHPRL